MENKLEMTKIINYFTYKYKGDWDNVYTAIKNKEKVELIDLEEFRELDKVNFISIIDEKYPENYKTIYMPPLTLYYYGNKEILYNNKKIISLWGNINQETFNKIVNHNNVYALEFNKNNLNMVNDKINMNIDFILIDQSKYNINNNYNGNNILYLSEIPYNSKTDYKLSQNLSRMLLGISSLSIFLNHDDKKFDEYLQISKFEKREMQVFGNFNNIYLNEAKEFKQ